MPSVRRSRGFCFTYFFSSLNEQETAEDNILSLDTEYLIYQYEMCPTTSKIHLQGYMYFTNPVTFTMLHNNCPNIWIQKAKGSPQQNIDYCSKSASRIDGPYEHGMRPRQGSRSDLASHLALIKDGVNPMDVVAANPMASRHIKHLMVYQASITTRPSNFEPKVYIRWGPSGSGKTRWCYDTYTSVYKLTYNKQQAWWDGYGNEKCILLDDWPMIEDENIYYWLLQWTDRYPCNIPFKGGMTRLGTGDIVLTHNEDPSLWFHNRGLRSLTRRITNIENIN